jgi:hypothetical protein
MKQRLMLAIIGWLGGSLMGWYVQHLTNWHYAPYLGILTGIVAVVLGERAGKIKTREELMKFGSFLSSERRHPG